MHCKTGIEPTLRRLTRTVGGLLNIHLVHLSVFFESFLYFCYYIITINIKLMLDSNANQILNLGVITRGIFILLVLNLTLTSRNMPAIR